MYLLHSLVQPSAIATPPATSQTQTRPTGLKSPFDTSHLVADVPIALPRPTLRDRHPTAVHGSLRDERDTGTGREDLRSHAPRLARGYVVVPFGAVAVPLAGRCPVEVAVQPGVRGPPGRKGTVVDVH